MCLSVYACLCISTDIIYMHPYKGLQSLWIPVRLAACPKKAGVGGGYT